MTKTRKETKMFIAIAGNLGIHVITTEHATQRSAEMAARRALETGAVDSVGIWLGNEQIKVIGANR